MPVVTAIRDWSQGLLGSVAETIVAAAGFIPQLVVAVLTLAVAWIAGKIIERLTVIGLQAVNFEELLGRKPLTEPERQTAAEKVSLTEIAGTIVFWAIFFRFGIVPAANVTGLRPAQTLIGAVLGFVPEVLAALLVLAATFFIAYLIRELINSTLSAADLSYARELSLTGWVLTVGFGFGVFLGSLGFNGSQIGIAVLIIASTVGLALAIGVGVGARELFGSIVAGRELRERIAEGDEVSVEEHSGKVERLGLDSVELRTPGGIVSVPNNVFVQKAVIKKKAA